MREIYSSIDTVTKCADIHTHTSCSDGKMTPFELVDMAKRLGICTIAPTDHNILYPSLLAQEYAQGSGVEVIPGMEISTFDGHILALYITSDIPKKKSLEWTIEAIHDQGGLAIAVHPLTKEVKGIGKEGVASVVLSLNPNVYLDGFEVHNAGLEFHRRLQGKNEEALRWYQELVREFPEKIGAAVGSSDAHYYTLGGGRTWYNGDLRNALKNRQTFVTSGYSGGKFEGLNTAYSEFGNTVFDRYWELKERNRK